MILKGALFGRGEIPGPRFEFWEGGNSRPQHGILEEEFYGSPSPHTEELFIIFSFQISALIRRAKST